MKKKSGRDRAHLSAVSTEGSAQGIVNHASERPETGTSTRGLVIAATRIASLVTEIVSGTATVMSAITETVTIAMNAIVGIGTVTDETTGIVTATESGDGAAALGPAIDTMTSVANASCECLARSAAQ